MFRLRRLLLSVPVASLLLAGVAFGDEPAKMDPQAAAPAAPAAQAPAAVIAGQPCNSCGTMQCDPCCAPSAPKIGLFGDYLFIKARNNDIPYARPVDDLTLSLTSGPISQVSQEFHSGYRFGAWYAPTSEITVRGTYTNWKNTRTDETESAEGFLLKSLVTVPEVGNNSIGFLAAGAAEELKLMIVDVDASFTVWGGCDKAGRLAAVAGFRYGRLEQNFGAAFASAQSTETVFTQATIEGYGPRVGLEGDVALCKGFYFYGSGIWSLLVGRQTASYSHSDEFQGLLVETNYNKDRIVPTFDLEMGIGVTCCHDHLNVRAGYMISSWGNLVTTNGLVQSVQGSDFTTNRDNLRDWMTFDGLVVRAEFRW